MTSSADINHTMRIHGKWYDVEHFDHPGGPIMLALGKGRDATGLFEVIALFILFDRPP